MRKPSEGYSFTKNNFWVARTLAGVTLAHDSLRKKLRMNEGLMPIPSPIEDVIGSQMDVLVVDNNHGRGLRVKMCVWLGVSRGLDLAFLNAD